MVVVWIDEFGLMIRDNWIEVVKKVVIVIVEFVKKVDIFLLIYGDIVDCLVREKIFLFFYKEFEDGF